MCVVPSVIVLLITAFIVFYREIISFSLPVSKFWRDLLRSSRVSAGRSRRQPA